MTTRSPKRVISSSEEGSVSSSSTGRDDERTIPFLRRLRDMLVENEDVISFRPGQRSHKEVTLGRIIVRDRIIVESSVLPRYFNHSSFASLRRQLNYFSFVRLGKGRQRESTYVNKDVIELEDILHLKRRSAGHAAPTQEDVASLENMQGEESSDPPQDYVEAVVPVVHLPVNTAHKKGSKRRERKQRRLPRKHKTIPATPETEVTSTENCISEDEQSEEKQNVALDLTKPCMKDADDQEILAGCNALLELAHKGWN